MIRLLTDHRSAPTGLDRQARLSAVEGLDLRLLVDRQHQAVRRRINIKADDGMELFGESRIIGTLEGLDPIRLQIVLRPDPLHRTERDADRLGDGSPGPMGHFTGSLRAGQGHHPELDLLGQGWPAWRPRSIFQKPGNALLGKPLLPAPHRRPAHANRIGNRGNRPTIRRTQHNPRSLDMLVSSVSIGNDRLQTRTIIAAKQNAHCLCHANSLAASARQVNLMFVSDH